MTHSYRHHASRKAHVKIILKRFNLYLIGFCAVVFGVALFFFLRPHSSPPQSLTFNHSALGDGSYSAHLNGVGIDTSLSSNSHGAVIDIRRDGSSLQFIQPLSNTSVSGTDGNKTVSFSGSGSSATFEYQLQATGLKETIVLKAKPTTNQFTSVMNTNGLVINKTSDGVPVFTNTKGVYQFHFVRPYATDAAGNKTYAITYKISPTKDLPHDAVSVDRYGRKQTVILGLTGDRLTDSSYTLTTEIDSKWLNDPKRIYPIRIDPTITHSTSSTFAGGILNRVFDTGSGSNPALQDYYQELPSDANTVGLWHLNETSGSTAIDSSGNGNTGTNTGTTFNTTTQLMGAAARTFNGSSDLITVTDTTILKPTRITMEAWFKTTSASTMFLVSKYLTASPSQGYGFYVYSGLSCWVGGNTWTTTPSLSKVIDGNWHHAACTYDGVNANIYLDGQLIVSQAESANLSGAINLSIGASVATYYFAGSIQEVRISNIARTPEEIKADAQRRPYAVYTSPVTDLGPFITASFSGLSWNESGVETGSGETASSSANLVAQWNFNETSGNVASVGTGSCGSTCNLYLVNFNDLTGQDTLATGSGWTANNKRWGAGAVMFDGIKNYATVTGNPAALQITGALTLEAWVKTSTASGFHGIIGKMSSGPSYGYALRENLTSGAAEFGVSSNGSAWTSVNGTKSIGDSQWHHLVGVYIPSTSFQIYMDGVLQNTLTTSIPASIFNTAANVSIGSTYSTPTGAEFFQGTIDAPRIYSRALSASEILSNYNAGNIEMETRVGNTLTPDDGTWEAWKPTTSETQINSMDNVQGWATPSATVWAGVPIATSSSTMPKMEGNGALRIKGGYEQVDPSTVGLWHLDETGGSGAYIKDSSPNGNNLTPVGSTSVDGVAGMGRSFNGSSDYIYMSSNTTEDIPVSGNFSAEAWIKTYSSAEDIFIEYTSTPAFAMIVDSGAGANKLGVQLKDNGGTLGIFDGKTSINDGIWHYVAVTALTSGASRTINLYVDGKNDGTGTWATNGAMTFSGGGTTNIGFWNGSSTFNGSIDEVRLSNRARTAEEIAEAYRNGRDHRLSLSIPSTDLSTKTKLPIWVASDRPGRFMEATVGKSAFVNYEADANTVGLWHMDEADIKPSMVTTGLNLWLKADAITGLSDGSSISTWNDLSGYGRNLTQITGTKQPIYKINIINSLPVVRFTAASLQQLTNATNFGTPQTVIYVSKQAGTTNGRVLTSITNNWLLGYWSGNKNQGYFDGWVTATGGTASDTNWHVYSAVQTGALSSVYGDGTLIASNAGGVTGINGISLGCFGAGTECSDADVAEVIIYNSALSSNDRSNVENYLNSKYNINGSSGSTVYIKDVSGNGYNATASGTLSVQGQIGRARLFNGASDKLGIIGVNPFRANFTFDAWVNFTNVSKGSDNTIVSSGTNVTDNGLHIIERASRAYFGFYGDDCAGSTILTANTWYHLAYVYDGGKKIYVNGKLDGSCTSNPYLSTMTNTYLGLEPFNANSYLSGTLDEVRVSNTARTADDIRQAFEVGKRTHPIVVDFAASPSSVSPISSLSTLSFVVNATTSGALNNADFLYPGDKLIVKENYNGTEYIAQGTVSTVNHSTGAVTLVSWDAGSTAPAGGFSPAAAVFKWQREWIDLTGALPSQMTAATRLTLRLNNGSMGENVWLDDWESGGPYLATPTGSAITSSIGSRYFQYRSILSTTDTNVSASLNSASISYTSNAVPNTPTLDLPSNTATRQAVLTVLKTTATDPNSDYLRYKIVLCTNSLMTVGCQTFDQTISQTGWSGQNTQASTAYTSGTQGVYTLQTPLAGGTTYYWDSYAIDPAGTNTFGSTQGTPYSFTTNTAPTSSTGLLTNGLTNPTNLLPTAAPYFSAVYQDPNVGDVSSFAQIQVSTDSTLTGSVTNWDTGTASITPTTQGSRSGNITYAGATLAPNTTYYWRIRFMDSLLNAGAWSSIANFTTGQLFATNCTLQKNVTNTQITVNWSNDNTINDGYTIERNVDGAGFSAFVGTGPTGTSAVDSTVSSGHTYAYRVKATLGGLVSNWCTTSTLSLQQPAAGTSSLQFY